MSDFKKFAGLYAGLLFLVLPVWGASTSFPTDTTSTTTASSASFPAAPAATKTSAKSAAASNALESASSVVAVSTGVTASPQNPALPQAQATYAGAFTWSYPFKFPAGTNGVQPSLSLTYNSSARNSVVGIGFSLTGLSVIERDASRGISFTSSDQYILDGQKLYYSSTANSGDGNFHPQNESYDRIQAFSPSTGGASPVANPNVYDSYWVVTKKD